MWTAAFALLLVLTARGWAQDSAPADNTQSAQTTAASGPPMTVSGFVTNSATGEPLPRVLVRVEGDADAAVMTNGEGHFEIPDVPLGPQTVRLTKPGYRDRPYAMEEVDDQTDGPPHNVLVAPGMKELGFLLTPVGVIHGHVELSTGDEGQCVTVVLLKQVIRYGRGVWTQVGTKRTAGDGSYRFGGLADGIYAVYTEPLLESDAAATAVAPGDAANVERSGYPSVFFPGVLQFASATRIRLGVGEQAEADLLLSLEPFHTVTAAAYFPDGRLFTANDHGGGQAAMTVSVLDAGGHRVPYTGEFDGATSTIQAALPDGSYTLQVSATANGPASAGSMKQSKTLLSGFVELSVAGHAVTNLRIPLAPMASWPVHVRVLHNSMQTVQASATPVTDAANLVTVTATNAGELPVEGANENEVAEGRGPDQLELSGAGSGPRWINVMANDRTLCVDSFTAGGINLAREPLDIDPSGSPPPMELTLRDDCAQLSLQLPPSLAAFLPGDEPFYTVYVVPDFDTPADLAPMTIHASSGGNVMLNGLTPGSYHVYTFSTPVRLAYRQPGAIAAAGQQVTLTAGTTVSLVLEVPGQ